MHFRPNMLRASLITFIAAVIMLSLGFYAQNARADISNPHPTPPSNSVTHAMLTANAVTDTNVDTAAAIQYTKITTPGSDGQVIWNSAGVFATDPAFHWVATGRTLMLNAGTIAATSTNFNAVAYTWPAAQGSANTVLVNDGSGTLSWGSSGLTDKGSNNSGSTSISGSNVATTTVLTSTIAPSSWTSSNMLAIWGTASTTNNATDCYGSIQVGNGSATTTYYTEDVNSGYGYSYYGTLTPSRSGMETFYMQKIAQGNTTLTPTSQEFTTYYATTTNIYIAYTARIGGPSGVNCGWVQADIKLM